MPVRVIVVAPTAAELLTFSVNVLVVVVGGVTEVGLNDAVTPVGNPLAVRMTF